MNYVYVLRSLKDSRWYTGMAADLRKSIRDHELGRVESTRHRRPFQLVYYEACLAKSDAARREQYLKSGRGKRYLGQRLHDWIASNGPSSLERHLAGGAGA